MGSFTIDNLNIFVNIDKNIQLFREKSCKKLFQTYRDINMYIYVYILVLKINRGMRKLDTRVITKKKKTILVYLKLRSNYDPQLLLNHNSTHPGLKNFVNTNQNIKFIKSCLP